MNIKMYCTPTCPWCKKAMNYLKSHNINVDYYVEYIDVSTNQDSANEMIEKSGQMGVPVIDIEGTIIVGFDPSAIDKALIKTEGE